MVYIFIAIGIIGIGIVVSAYACMRVSGIQAEQERENEIRMLIAADILMNGVREYDENR